jgi:ABC-type lipoprotein release transport system permease subunit
VVPVSYRRTLLFRWSRQDRLTVLVVAVTVAFLVGTVLFVFAAGSQTAAIAAELDSPGSATYYGSAGAAETAADGEDVVLPVAAVTDPDGDRTYAVGVPPDTDRTFGERRLVGDGPTRGSLEAPATHRLDGETTVTVDVEPRSGSILAPDWYAVGPATVDELGTTGAFVVDAEAGTGGETPLRGVLRFFTTGTQQMLGIVGLIAVAGGLLVAITAYSTTRMTVADRREDIRVVRATGGTPRTVLWLFALRAGLVGAVGVALGYALGVIAANAAVNVAVAVGLPTSLSVAITREIAAFLGALVVAMVVVAVLGGLLAARRAAVVPPARVVARDAGDDGLLPLRVLDARALVPTAATLTAFLLVSSVFVGAAAVVAPLATTDQATISQPGAGHPVASQVPAGYVEGLEERDIDASGEILLFGVRNGRPLPMRGVDYEDFASISGAEMVEGRAPTAPDEAVVGTKLGGNLEVGDTVTVGGSTRSAVTRIHVVGRFEADGADGAALLVSHRTARHLSNVGSGEVNVVRASRLPKTSEEGIVVTRLSTVEEPVAGQPTVVEITLSNTNPAAANETVAVRFAGQRRSFSVDLGAGGTATRRIEFGPVSPGSYDLAAGETRKRVRVQRPDQLAIRGLPAEAPPGSRPLVEVVDARGSPGANVSVRVGDTERRTTDDGTVRIPLNGTGSREVVAGDGETAARATVSVRAGVSKRPTATLELSPDDPDVLVRPVASLEVRNPWTEPLGAEVTVRGPTGETARRLELAPGERRTVTRRLDRRPPGTYDVTATVDGRAVGNLSYRVSGDDRISAALATSGREGSSPLGEAIEVAFGDLQLVAVALVGLAAAMTVGATTATFAATVRARRQVLGVYRASGAPPARIFRLVVGDALRVGVVATVFASVLAGVGLVGLDRAGVLTVFGVRLLPAIDPLVAVGVAATALAVVAVSATLATVAIVRASPAALLRDRSESESGGAVRE